MELSVAFLLYAALFRLAVILAGTVCIILGARLLTRGTGNVSTEASLEAGGTKLSIQTAAPGICFALFGAGLIVAMLITGSPTMILEEAERITANDGSHQEVTSTTQLKGGSEARNSAQREFDALLEMGQQREAAGDRVGAIAAYAEALTQGEVRLTEAAVPLTHIARLYREDARQQEALPLARLAVALAPENADLFHLLAQILADQGESQEARIAAEEAVRLAPDRTEFQATLRSLR